VYRAGRGVGETVINVSTLTGTGYDDRATADVSEAHDDRRSQLLRELRHH
jgi:hypothetical protein